MTFKAYIKKEFIEAKRENKLMILFMGFFFFALSTPPMLKLTPKLLEKQYGTEMSSLFKTSALDSVANYLISTLPQLCILVLCLTLGGILCNEISKGSIILPITKGANKSSIVIAKFSFYGVVIFIISTISVITNIYYSFIVFQEDLPSIKAILICSTNVYIYLLFILSLIFLFSSLFKKSMGAALLSMGINIGLVLLNTFNYSFNPFKLISEGGKLSSQFAIEPLIITSILTILAILASIYIFIKKEMEA
ncbi:ABC transporter permease subunit [Clostridium vincentii]|uniref:ABC-2 family transporter protein n=1 Tax=Clostridium vincentii TaxID=52704 RepID=A0A2T0BIP9_9CLOT|nr:ABC transporter permease subunit [Clostridium vincentii]PRR83759.1 ABC-2 family transporter protein [Clostridium vincentii]